MDISSHLSHPDDSGDIVVLLHGLWMGRWVMAMLGHRLSAKGFQVKYFNYPTVRRDIRQSAYTLSQRLLSIQGERVHFIGHSLGGLVIHQLFHDYPVQRPGCVISLGTPYNGSVVAREAVRQMWGRRVLGQNATVLCEGLSFPWQAVNPHGVIAGDLAIGLGRMVYHLEQPNDGLVSASETQFAGMSDWLLLRANHTSMLFSVEVSRQISHFLVRGGFVRSV